MNEATTNELLDILAVELGRRKVADVYAQLTKEYKISNEQFVTLCYTLIKAKRITDRQVINKITRYQIKHKINVS